MLRNVSAALGKNRRATCIVNCAVNAATAEEMRVGSIYDRFRRLHCNVTGSANLHQLSRLGNNADSKIFHGCLLVAQSLHPG